MSTKKFLTGGIVGAIVFFLLGYLVYGVLLADFMKTNAGSATGVEREMSQMIWWSLILGNLCIGFLLSYVLQRANASSASEAAGISAVVGLLMSSGHDFIMYATSNIANLTGVIADIAAFTVMSAISGAVIALVAAPKKRMAAAQ